MPEEWYVTLKECRRRCSDWFWLGTFAGVIGTIAFGYIWLKVINKANIIIF